MTIQLHGVMPWPQYKLRDCQSIEGWKGGWKRLCKCHGKGVWKERGHHHHRCCKVQGLVMYVSSSSGTSVTVAARDEHCEGGM